MHGQNVVNISALVDLLSDTCVLPTILNCLRSHCIPCLSCHQHNLQEVNLVYVLLSCIIHIYCTRTESFAIMCLEASNNSCIKRLDVWCEIRLKVNEFDIGGFIRDHMAREVVDSERNMPPITMEVLVNLFEPFFEES